jgi:uncharacterized membrane protein YeiB
LSGSPATTGRIAGLDVARGLAVLGMFAAPMRLGEDLATWLALATAAVLGATLWRLRIGRGPLEWLLTWTSSRAAGLPPSSPAV